MWDKLGELNKKFKDIKKHERSEDRKMSATIKIAPSKTTLRLFSL